MRDFLEILSRVEAHYDQAAGGNQDTILAGQLTGFANDTLDEVNRERRWSLSYREFPITTVAGTQAYIFPQPTNITDLTFVKRVYRYDSTTGRSVELKRYERGELQRVWGDVSGTQNRGKPTHFSIEGVGNLNITNMQLGQPNNTVLAPRIFLYPCPDDVYTINVGSYFGLPKFIEVTGTTTAGSATLTVPSTIYLTNSGLSGDATNTQSTVSIKGAGELSIGTATANHITYWTNFPSGTTVTLFQTATTAKTAVQTIFNSTNWLINHWPKVLLFGMLREVAAYYGKWDDASAWESKYQDQLAKLGAWEDDKGRGLERLAAAQAGQNASIFRESDRMSIYDIRGGV